jgi:hypothetical protein
VRLNKAALMRALGPYGITDERLNAVSNYYRYNRSLGQEVWRSTPAKAYARVENGAVTGFTIIDGGSGYSSPPQISVPGVGDVRVTVTLSFGKEFSTNGSVTGLTTNNDGLPHGTPNPVVNWKLLLP